MFSEDTCSITRRPHLNTHTQHSYATLFLIAKIQLAFLWLSKLPPSTLYLSFSILLLTLLSKYLLLWGPPPQSIDSELKKWEAMPGFPAHRSPTRSLLHLAQVFAHLPFLKDVLSIILVLNICQTFALVGQGKNTYFILHWLELCPAVTQ